MCAARIASVEANSPRSSASDTPARAAISARPICSNGCSASSAMKRCDALSRLDAGGGARGAGRRAGLERRLALRAMTRPPDTLALESINLVPRTGPFQGAACAQPASSAPRACAAAATALVISGSTPSSPISTSSAAAVVPPGEVTFARSVAAIERRAMQQFAGAGDGLARQLVGERRRQTGGDAGLRQRFGQQEHIGRAGARHRRDRVHQRLVIDPFDRAGRGEQRRARACARARSTRRIADRDGDAAADRGRRVGHGAHDGGARQAPVRGTPSVRPAMIETTTVFGPTSVGAAAAARRARSAASPRCTSAATLPILPLGLMRTPRSRQRLDRLRRLRLDARRPSSAAA